MASHARGRSRLGDSTAPSSIARRLQPIRRLPNQNDAHSAASFSPPTRAASPRPPRSRRIALPPGKSGDRDGPAPAAPRSSSPSAPIRRSPSIAPPAAWPTGLWAGVNRSALPQPSGRDTKRIARRVDSLPRRRSDAAAHAPRSSMSRPGTSQPGMSRTLPTGSTRASETATGSTAGRSAGSPSSRPEWTVLREPSSTPSTTTTTTNQATTPSTTSREPTASPTATVGSSRGVGSASAPTIGTSPSTPSTVAASPTTTSSTRLSRTTVVRRRSTDNDRTVDASGLPGPIVPGWRRVVGLPDIASRDNAADERGVDRTGSRADGSTRPSLAERVARLASDSSAGDSPIRRSSVAGSGDPRFSTGASLAGGSLIGLAAAIAGSSPSMSGGSPESPASPVRRSASSASSGRPVIGSTLAHSIATGGAVGAVARTVVGRQVGATSSTSFDGAPDSTRSSGTVRRTTSNEPSSRTTPSRTTPVVGTSSTSVTGAGADAARSFRERMEQRGIVLPEPTIDSPTTTTSSNFEQPDGDVRRSTFGPSDLLATAATSMQSTDSPGPSVGSVDAVGASTSPRRVGQSGAELRRTASLDDATGRTTNDDTRVEPVSPGSTDAPRTSSPRVAFDTPSWRRDGAAIGARGTLRRSVRGPRPARRRTSARIEDLPVAPALARGADPAPPGTTTTAGATADHRASTVGLVGSGDARNHASLRNDTSAGDPTSDNGDPSPSNDIRRSSSSTSTGTDSSTIRRATVRRRTSSSFDSPAGSRFDTSNDRPVGRSNSSSSDATISADDMARMLEAGFEPTPTVVTRRVAGLSSSPIRRSPSGSSGSADGRSNSGRPGALVLRRTPATLDSMAPGPVSILSQVLQSPSDVGESGMSVTTSQLLDLVDWINRMVDERLRLELERRGVSGGRW